MKLLYFDCLSGISGDMTIASLLDLGIPFKHLQSELRRLGLGGEYHLRVKRSRQLGITGLRFEVECPGHHAHHHHSHDHDHGHGRSFADIRRLIQRSKPSPFVRQRATSIFERIAKAEGKIHGVAIEEVHFHEVGAVDSIVDIVGACVLLEAIAPDRVEASVPHDGHGFVECAHGRLPVPTPATLEILKNIPLRQIDVQGELITPTGAAILAEFAQGFGPMSHMVVQKTGYGLGSRTYPNHPNFLRVILGAGQTAPNPDGDGAVDVIETNLDDVSPEVVAAATEKLFSDGARDVFLTPVQMKKGRAGTMITVLAAPADAQRLTQTLLRETGTFGVRIRRAERLCLARELRIAKTRFGNVEIKIGSHGGSVISVKPELESCRKLAVKAKKPVRIIWAVAMAECSRLLAGIPSPERK